MPLKNTSANLPLTKYPRIQEHMSNGQKGEFFKPLIMIGKPPTKVITFKK